MSKPYLTVTALTKYIKQKIDSDPHLSDVYLRGEISNFNHHQRGHMYMTIKDENSRVQAVMFAGSNRFLKFTPENGMKILLRGNISVFEPYGQYQFYIKQMEPDGVGSLHLAFEQLKEKLSKQGYFDQTIKKPIPKYPKHIGIVTSSTGAAVRDIITTIKRRYPIVKLTVIPVQVQGEGSAQSIKEGIEQANEHPIDLLIVGRGGGSIEDLWAFNEEIVAKAIYYSEIPIISAVGHETDVTISDFVSDLRAPTPTGAAELAVPSKLELNDRLLTFRRLLSRNLLLNKNRYEDHLKRLKRSLSLQTPKRLIEQKEQQFDYQFDRLNNVIQSIINENKYKYDHLKLRFNHLKLDEQIELKIDKLNNLKERKHQLMKQIYERKVNDLMQNINKLTLVNPLNIMNRGYTITMSTDDKIVKTSENINEKDEIKVKFADGIATCVVKDVWRDNNG